MLRLHLILFHFGFCFILLGQENSTIEQGQLSFTSYTSAQGLPSPSTYNTYQDQHGFLWISTGEGLTRFDGYSFKPYYDDPSKRTNLKGACGFYEDKEGTLWVINGTGYLYKYDRGIDDFVNIKKPLEDGWDMPSAHTILPDTSGNLWISSYGGLLYYDLNSDTLLTYEFNEIRSPESWPHPEKVRLGPMYLDESQNLWIGTIKFGLIKYDIANESTTFYRFKPGNLGVLLDDLITDILPIDENKLLIADVSNGLVIWDINTETADKIRINALLGINRDISINDIYQVSDELYWLATDESGLLLFNIKTRTIEDRYVPNSNDPLAIGDYKISHISSDINNTYWLGSNTLQQGSTGNYKFGSLINQMDDPNSLQNNDIYWMAPLSDGNVLVSTADGVCILETQTLTFKNSPIYEGAKPGASYGVGSSEGDNAWIGTYNTLLKVNLDTRQPTKSYKRDIIVDEQNNIMRRACRILEDSRSSLWVIDHWGRLKYIEPEVDYVTNVFELAQDTASGKFVNCLTTLDLPARRQILVGMDMGVALVSYDDQKVTRLKLSYEDVDLSSSVYSYLYRDSQEQIWAIINGKTYLLNLEKLQLELLDLNTTYNVGSFRWIVEEPKGTYWLSSFKGIVKYDYNNEKSSLFYTPNVGGSSFNDPSPVVESGGKIFFGGYKGISILDPKNFEEENYAQKAIISEISVNQDRLVLDQPIYETEEVILNYDKNDVTLYLTNFSFSNQSDCKYKYRLLPLDEEWINHGNNQKLELSNLGPDDYTLEVTASNGQGIWSEDITRLSIVISPPWWETLWARMISIFLGLGLILSIQRYRYINKLKKQEEFASLRNKISDDLHDDVGSILTGIAMQSELLENFVSDDNKHSAHQIAANSREAMGRMRDTVWAINSKKDSSGDLIDRMLDFLEYTLTPRDLSYQFNNQDFDFSLRLKPNKRQCAFLIFKESITNIAKHSDCQNVIINISIKNKLLSMDILDDGSLKDHTKSSGIGLLSMSKRAKQNGGSYSFIYNKGYQTKLRLPLD